MPAWMMKGGAEDQEARRDRKCVLPRRLQEEPALQHLILALGDSAGLLTSGRENT